jgi:hypothetical protein
VRVPVSWPHEVLGRDPSAPGDRLSFLSNVIELPLKVATHSARRPDAVAKTAWRGGDAKILKAQRPTFYGRETNGE